jgi:hypothetical protein
MASSSNNSTPAQSGPGARCPEAQADGVPCSCLGIDCEECGRARRETAPPGGLTGPRVPHA